MTDISNVNQDGLPSTKSLIKATIVALVVSVAILVTTILPAEYGVDPTGVGHMLGLDVLSSAHVSNESAALATSELVDVVASEGGLLWKSNSTLKNNTVTLTLLPKQGAEIKSPMNAGDNFVFNWQVDGGSVYFDMHGEPPNAAKDMFTSYWIGNDEQQASGNFIAPFEGTHGWYWQNNSDAPVKITLTTTGFYGDLYMP